MDKPFEMPVSEDSRVQARLWNSFMKNMHDREVDTAALMNYSVTPLEIMKVTLQSYQSAPEEEISDPALN